MKLPSYLAAALAASLALLSQGSAMAAGTATASISNVQFGVLDLTPGDGVAAGYSIDDFSTRLYANLRSWTEDESEMIWPNPYMPASVGYERGSSHAWSSSGGAIGELASDAAAHPNLDIGTRLITSSLQEISVTLRPHSLLMVSGHFSVLAERAPGGGMDFSASGQTRADLETDGNRYSAGRYFSVYPGEDTSDGWEQDFALTYGNNSNHDIELSLSFYTHANADTQRAPFAVSPVSAVPEPGTWAMLGTGLALVGFAARRRRLQVQEQPA